MYLIKCLECERRAARQESTWPGFTWTNVFRLDRLGQRAQIVASLGIV